VIFFFCESIFTFHFQHLKTSILISNPPQTPPSAQQRTVHVSTNQHIPTHCNTTIGYNQRTDTCSPYPTGRQAAGVSTSTGKVTRSTHGRC
jgi:hypothetical protein